jgi:hypothetical protein
MPSLLSVALLLVTLALVMITTLQSPEKDDIAWLLYVAHKWLAGKQLYVDLIEVNPPLIVWIYAVPAGIANWLGAEPRLVATPLFALVELASAWWTATLLRPTAPIFTRRLPVFSLIGIVLLAIPGVEFGQREHLLIAGVLPYLVIFARVLNGEREPRRLSVATGILAGLGCALKPTYALVFVTVEILALARGFRPVRIGTVAAVVTMALYGLLVVIFCPAFLDKAVPLALALYGGTDTALSALLCDSWRVLAGLAVTMLLCWTSRDALRRREPFMRMLILTLAAFAAGASLSFVLEAKNWFYHRLPATVATLLALFAWMAVMLPELKSRGWWHVRPMLQLGLAVAVLVIFGMGDYSRLAPWVADAVNPGKTTIAKLERLVRQQHARTYIAFSEWIGLGFPVVNNTGVAWASRFDSMWALRGELWRMRHDGIAPKAWPIRRWVARDFVVGCPDLAVVDTRGAINYVAILVASDVNFAQAWSHYREIAVFDGLRVLKRITPNCAPEKPALQHLSAADPEPTLP